MNSTEQQQKEQSRQAQSVPSGVIKRHEEGEEQEEFKKQLRRFKIKMMNMNNKSHLSAACLAIVLVLFVLINEQQVACQEQLLVENRQLKGNEIDMEALKDLERLEDLDKLWSEKARPRFGRSKYKQQFAFARQQQQPIQPKQQSLVDLLNARLAQKYHSNDAY